MIKGLLTKLRIKQRIMLAYVGFVFIPMLIIIIMIYFNVSGVLLSYLLNGAEMTLVQRAGQISNQVDKMKSTMNIVASNDRIKNMLKKLGSNDTYDLAKEIDDYNSISEQLRNTQISTKIEKLRLYVNDKFYFSSENDFFNSYTEIQDEYWYDNLNQDNSNFVCFFESYTDQWGIVHNVLSTARLILNPVNFRQYVAAIKAEYPIENMKQELLLEDDNEGFYIFSNDGASFGINSEKQDWIKNLDSAYFNKWEKIEVSNITAYRYVMRINNTNLMVAQIITLKKLYSLRNERLVLLIFLLIFISIITFIFASVVSRMSAKRIAKLEEKMKRVQKGYFNIELDHMGYDEIGQINETFNTMIVELRELLNTREKMAQQIKDTELIAAKAQMRALQSQINPHFLYNTLDLIMWKSLDEEIENAEALIQDLAKYFKLIFNDGNDIVPIAHEIEHVTKFVNIQNMRLGNTIKFFDDVDEVSDCLLPKISLQPIVENAIIHGMGGDAGRGIIIEIAGRLIDNAIIQLVITDNGVGMSENVLDKLNSGGKTSDGYGGIRNVNDRIKLLYGDKYSLKFMSQLNKGTVVTLEVPKNISLDHKGT